VQQVEGVQPDEDVNNRMFTVVRSCKDAGASDVFKLSKGDVIKLGRLKFKVKDFRTDTIPACEDNSPCKGRKSLDPEDYDEDGEHSEEAVEIDCGVVDSSQPDVQCRFCWSNEQDSQNPLLNSCKCAGSVRYIHYECLKNWLKVKMNKKEEESLISYVWKQFECEICKKAYPCKYFLT